ncbi:DUF3427 domain-containing protein [Actinomadura rudentiformis]|uniref:DUF3427 domain-containing protein n=1 Tax=Actinomadura rudentiformis TaxID=359158 RepID=A0A6H9YZW8_9ACTN|nr:DEAD/DEAH box helicase [Actinomadura rudentiformis]KAB2347736.1 DUF3427 domain-containing protein [Actinomadura rudentiformis]
MDELAPGAYESLVTAALEERLRDIEPDLVYRDGLAAVDAEEMLVRHVAVLVKRSLKIAGSGKGGLKDQVKVVNQIGEAIAAVVPESVVAEDLLTDGVLLGIAAGRLPDGSVTFPVRPDIPLSSSALLVNGREQPQIGREVAKELATADRVDLLIAFVKWHGLRLIEDELRAFVERGGQLRVITTTYMGATEARAVERLVELGAEVAISFDTRRTRLHAKAWLFRRGSGLDTAYIGSSNLSRAALLDGVEWNVRLARAEQGHLIDTFAATFEEYWNEPSFERYEPERDRERLNAALRAETGSVGLPLQIANIDVQPYPYQQEILEELDAVREVHGHYRNLVVMATGTGKTIVAALDYERLRRQGKVDSLLFVAHRKEILQQSLSTFRTVLKDGAFGELLVDGNRPSGWKHVFASIQSLQRLPELRPDSFSVVIVDEFHHAAADSYGALLDRVTPTVLLGLTATPERSDGEDILHWFDGRKPDVELRLWEALERGLLVPFHYFGIHDDTDLSRVKWRRGGGYDVAELTELYTNARTRVDMVVQALVEKLGSVTAMKAVGFCVSIQHAQFMANQFDYRGIPARAVTSAMSSEERDTALRELREGTVKAVFTVDLFNEGVDVPDIDTVIFLRPTDSATVFLQQLGRGLRLTPDKPVLTVLDFVGHQHKDFRFDRRFTALTGIPRGRLPREVEAGFPTLPAGCAINLDREVSQIVLANIKHALQFSVRDAAAELRELDDPPLGQFLAETGRELEDLYGGSRGGWARLRRAAGYDTRPVADDDLALGKAIGRMLHMDDPERLEFLREVLAAPWPPAWGSLGQRQQRLLAMLHASLDGKRPISEVTENLRRLWGNEARREELSAVIDVLWDGIHRVTPVVEEIAHLPVRLHARYSRDELLAAFGMDRPGYWVSGVRWFEQERADVFMVNINKSEKDFSPTTMYEDRAITPTLFQWESQSTTPVASETGQRYIHHAERGSTVHLFLRETRVGSPPYLYAGPMTYVSHERERPMRILWELPHPLPADVFHYAKVNTG